LWQAIEFHLSVILPGDHGAVVTALGLE